VSGAGDAPPLIEDRLRAVCLALPEAYQEQAWVGTRWRVRKRTFAHVLTVEPGWAPVHQQAFGVDGTACVVTFRAPGEEFGALVASGFPFYRVGWGHDVVGMVLGDQVDWDEVAELMADSYCVLAPKKLAALVQRAGG
jgi:predicted DNA-binding protein (MmcQ/YjbR family)